LCHRLKNNKSICGPNLPSSGTICIIQALIIYESISKETDTFNINNVLSILDFVYSLRSETLADDKFEDIDVNSLLNEDKLLKRFKNFLQINKKTSLLNLDELFNSTTHFSVVDKDGNIVSATSSIESSFGSRLFTNGFFLNNQLTDFSFKIKNSAGDFIKNRVVGGKRPLSSMSPIIVFDENGELVLTIGSPGGKAIIAYVFRVLIETLYNKIDVEKSLNNPNYLRIKGRTFLEDKSLRKNLIGIANIRNLTSGLAVIYKTNDGYLGVADTRRDGTVMGN
jgi:gamma-glutamyltranspeptidase/glutathione hydrolase